MDISEINKRFLIFVDNLGYSYVDLSKKLGIAQPVLSKIKNNIQSPLPFIDKFAILGLNLNWLITGKGSMYLKDNISSEKILEIKFITEMESIYFHEYIKNDKLLKSIIANNGISEINSFKLYHIIDNDRLEGLNDIILTVNFNNPEYVNNFKFAVLTDIIYTTINESGVEQNVHKMGRVLKFDKIYVSIYNEEMETDIEMIVENQSITNFDFIVGTLNKDYKI